jgi:hypothetical protein
MDRTIPSSPSASVLQGLWFVFHHGNHRIALWTSSFTGREELYVDDALVAEKRTLALVSSFEFAVGATQYAVELSTRNLLRGISSCVLRADGVSVAALELDYVVHRRSLQRALAISMVAGALFVELKVGAAFNSLAVGIVVVSILAYVWLGRRNRFEIRAISPPGPPGQCV